MMMPLSAPSCSVLLACWKFSSHSYAYQHLLTYFRQKESGQLKHYKYYLCLNPPCFDWGRLGSAQTNTKGGTSDLQQTGRQAVSNSSDFGNRYSHHLVLLSRATLWRPVLLWAKNDFFLLFLKESEMISETLRTPDLFHSKPRGAYKDMLPVFYSAITLR